MSTDRTVRDQRLKRVMRDLEEKIAPSAKKRGASVSQVSSCLTVQDDRDGTILAQVAVLADQEPNDKAIIPRALGFPSDAASPDFARYVAVESNGQIWVYPYNETRVALDQATLAEELELPAARPRKDKSAGKLTGDLKKRWENSAVVFTATVGVGAFIGGLTVMSQIKTATIETVGSQVSALEAQATTLRGQLDDALTNIRDLREDSVSLARSLAECGSSDPAGSP